MAAGETRLRGMAALDDLSASAYYQAVRRGHFTTSAIAKDIRISLGEAEGALRVLLDLRLLRPMPGEPDKLVPVSPDAAAAELLGTAETEILDLKNAVAEVRGRMMSLMPAYFEGRQHRNRNEAFDVVFNQHTIQSVIDEIMERCEHEVLTVQPGGARPVSVLDEARRVSLGLMERGLKLQTLYQHTARSDLATAAYVREVTAAGACYRTTDEVIDLMMIFDRNVALLPDRTVAGPVPGAVIIREPTLVGYLSKVFDHLWQRATPFAPDANGPEPVIDDVKRSIIGLMAKGFKDEVIARRLGMSVRTCRRHVSDITVELKADSRFQAGVRAAQMGLLDPADDLDPD